MTVQENIFALFSWFWYSVSLFPFHSWAPKGYAVAPTGAAMLHAGVLKNLVSMAFPGAPLPLGAEGWFSWIVWLALGNIIFIGLVTIA